MVKVKAGEKTRQLIVETCKTLFYQNGFSKTTYDMICRHADIAPGSITYHFKSKAEIAVYIANEFSARLESRIAEFIPLDEQEHWTNTYLVVRARWYVILRDPHLLHLYKELFTLETYSNPVIDILRTHRNFVPRELTKEDLMLIAATVVGQDGMIMNLAEQDPQIFTSELVSRYTLGAFFKLLDLDEETTKKAVAKGEALFQIVRNRLDASYFEEFCYTDPHCSAERSE